MPKTQTKQFQFLPFSEKQRRLMYWYMDGSPYKDCDMVIADGAIRSGKTIAMICGFFRWSLEEFHGETFILAGKTIGALKRNVIGPARQILEAWGLGYTYVSSGDEARLEVGENVYYMYDAHNERSQDRLQGLTAAGALADEVALFPRSFVEQMIGRCSVAGARLWLNCNPESPAHFVKTELIDKAAEKKIYHLHFLMDDNLTLSPKTRDRYARMFAGVFYRRFIKGEWAMTDGLVYPQFADDSEAFLIDSAPQIQYAVIGVDFGGTGSAHSFTLTGFTHGMRDVTKYYKAAEIYAANKIDEAALNAVLRSGLRQTMGEFKNITRTTVQAGGNQLYNVLNSAWLQVSTGAFDAETAIKNAIKQLAASGLNAVDYPSGKHDTLEVAVRRAVLTGANQTALKIQDEYADELGCDLVETTAHACARPSHAVWQGRVFSRSGKSTKYPSFRAATGYGTVTGLGGVNCRHSYGPYVEGAPRVWTDDQLKKLEEKSITYNGEKLTEYEASQRQRAIERQIRQWKRAEALGVDGASEKVAQWQKTQRNFIRQTGFKRQYSREQIYAVEKLEQSATIGHTVIGDGVNTLQVIGNIDVHKYAAVATNIRSSTVVLTDNQKEHIIKRRGQDFYDRYGAYFGTVAEDPDYIFSDKSHQNTAIACKTLDVDGANIHLVIRLAVEGDDPTLENSVITVLKENDKRYAQRLRNNKPLYKKE